MGEVGEGPDRVAIRRWLAAVGLLDTAEGLVARGSAAESLIVSQAAAETVLGLLAGWAPEPLPSQPKWDNLMAAGRNAVVAVGGDVPARLIAQLNASQTLRNGVVHRGSVAPQDEARASLAATRELIDLLPEVSAHFAALPLGAGLAGAVAQLIDAPDIAEQLIAAEAAVTEEKPGEAADAAARALSMSLGRSEPRLGGTDEARVQLGFMRFRSSGIDRDLVRTLEQTEERISDLERWVVGAILGIRPVDFGRLQRIVGLRIQYLGGTDSIHRAQEPALADAAWAVRQVAEIVYRLQETGSLIEGPAEEVWQKRQEIEFGR